MQNKRTVARAAALRQAIASREELAALTPLKAGHNLLSLLVGVAENEDQPMDVRLSCAKDALPYLVPRLAMVAVREVQTPGQKKTGVVVMPAAQAPLDLVPEIIEHDDTPGEP